MSELKSVALWHPDEKIFASWHDWFSSRGWMVIDVGESVSEVPEVGVWLVAWNEQFHRPQVRVEFEVRRQNSHKKFGAPRCRDIIWTRCRSMNFLSLDWMKYSAKNHSMRTWLKNV